MSTRSGPRGAGPQNGDWGARREFGGTGRATPLRDRAAHLLPRAPPVLCAPLLAAGRAIDATNPHAVLALYAASYLAGGTGSALVAWQAIRGGRVDVNALMLLAAVGAAYLGSWTDGAVLLILFSTSNALEFYVMGRTRHRL